MRVDEGVPRRVRARLSLAAALLVFAAVPSAWAADGEVVFAVGEWAPYVGESLPGHGYAASIVRAACGAAGLRARFEFYSWPRAEARVAEGLAFATFPFVSLPEREERFFLSEAVLRSSIAILRSTENPASGTLNYSGDPMAFVGRVVGTTAGTKAVSEPLRKAGVAVEETDTIDLSLLKLDRGRIDFVVEERIVLIDAVRRLFPRGAARFAFLERGFLDTRGYRLLVSRKYPGARVLLERFNAGLAAIIDNGTADRIRAEFGFQELGR
jgi:polar amino acid transport system substrate-binding protein